MIDTMCAIIQTLCMVVGVWIVMIELRASLNKDKRAKTQWMKSSNNAGNIK